MHSCKSRAKAGGAGRGTAFISTEPGGRSRSAGLRLALQMEVRERRNEAKLGQGRWRAGAQARRSNKVGQVQSPGHKPSSHVCCWGAAEAQGLHPASLCGQVETLRVGKADLLVFVGCPPCEHIHSPNREKAPRGRASVSLPCLWLSAGQLSAQKAVQKQPTRKNNQIKRTA